VKNIRNLERSSWRREKWA